MNQAVLKKLLSAASSAEAQAHTVDYLAGHLRAFVKRGDKVLICFSEHTEGGLGRLMERAVNCCGGMPVIWGPDHRWKTLLQQAFYSHASTIIGPPLTVLGLTKLKKYNGIPLYIRHVVTAGYPCQDWMIDGIMRGLDCSTWGSFGVGETGVVAGFSCGKSRGVHLRDSEYGVDIVDAEGKTLPDGEFGEMVLYSKSDPQLRLPMGEDARLETAPCPCGCASPRLMGMYSSKVSDPELGELSQYLYSWTSVLDCRLRKGDCGLELEMIVFPGEKLPKLPSAAKQIVRPWDPKHDEPFSYFPTMNQLYFSMESH